MIRYWQPFPMLNHPVSVARDVLYVQVFPDVHDRSLQVDVQLFACATLLLSVRVASPFAMYALQKMLFSVRSER